MSDTTSAPTQSDAQRFVPGGPPAAEEPGVQDGDFGVGPDAGDLKTQLLTALESRWNADDPGATTLDDEPAPDGSQPDPASGPPASSPADTAATPAPAPQPDGEPTPTQGQPDDQGGAGGGGAASDGTAAGPPDASAPSAPAPTTPQDADQFDMGAYFNDYFGTPLTREQAANLAGMISGLQALSPQQRAELDRVLAGGQPGQYPATMGQAVQPQPPMHPQQQMPDAAQDPAVAILGPRPDNDEYAAAQWDMSARLARASHEQTEAIRADIARTTEVQQAQERERLNTQVTAAQSAWREQYKGVLSDAEFDGLTQRAYQSGTFPALHAQYHGDVDAAVRALYEQQFWADESFRSRAIANLSSGRVAGDPTQVDPASPVAQQQAAVDQGRQALASSVSGGGGSITPQSAGVPTDPDKRKAAMVAELQGAHDWQG